MLHKLLLFIGLCVLHLSLNAQSNGGFIDDLQVVPTSCGDPTGSIELVTDDIGISIEWEGGETDKKIENLSSGLYSVTITDEVDGCDEILDVEVPNADCNIKLTLREGPGSPPSYFEIGVSFTMNGEIVPNEFLVFEWNYGGAVYNTPTLLVPYNLSPLVDLTVGLLPEYGEIPCCNYHKRIRFPKGFTVKKPPVYVYNTTFKNLQAEEKVPGRLELLIYGDGTCEGAMDLRGFIIDDNNGELVTAILDGIEILPSQINVSSGYLKFTNHSNWKKVPNGSLITIYERNHIQNSELSSIEDPTDSNSDFVYILNEQDETYLAAHSGQWEEDIAVLNYEAAADNTFNSWNLIKADGQAEGIQVRYPNGDYCHGVSFGKNEFTSEENLFPLYLSPTASPHGRIHMDNLSHYIPQDFTIIEELGGFNVGEALAGNPLTDIILGLRSCRDRSNLRNDESVVIEEQDKNINIYPNPFEKAFNIDFKCPQVGEVTINIFNSIGKTLISEKLPCDVKTNTHSFQLTENDSDGLYLLRFDFPDNTSITRKIVMMNR